MNKNIIIVGAGPNLSFGVAEKLEQIIFQSDSLAEMKKTKRTCGRIDFERYQCKICRCRCEQHQ